MIARASFTRLLRLMFWRRVRGISGGVDNVTLPTTGSGTATPVLATDDVGGVHYPIGKLAYGALDTATLVQAASGAGLPAQGDVAHDGIDAGNPVLLGGRAIAHGTNPTAVAAADRTVWLFNRAGVPFVMGGHPNVQSCVAHVTALKQDETWVAVAAGLKIVVTAVAVALSEGVTVGVNCCVGFGATTLPNFPAAPTGMVLTHPGLVPGGGFARGDGSGILGVGADGEDLRFTNTAITTASGGCLRYMVTYYTIES